jgi:hypothetical protein
MIASNSLARSCCLWLAFAIALVAVPAMAQEPDPPLPDSMGYWWRVKNLENPATRCAYFDGNKNRQQDADEPCEGDAVVPSYSPSSSSDWLGNITSSLPTTFSQGLDYLASYLTSGRRVCPFGSYENRLERWVYTSASAGIAISDQVFEDRNANDALDATEPMGWVLLLLGTGSENGVVLQHDDTSVIRGAFSSGATLKEVGATSNTIATSGTPVELGVYACESNSGFGFTTPDEVVIAPVRISTSDEPEAAPMIEAAFAYCMDNARLDNSISGVSGIATECRITNNGSPLKMNTRTAFIRKRTGLQSIWNTQANMPMIYWNPNPVPTTIAKASLPTCDEADEATYGIARVLNDACSLEDAGGESCPGKLTSPTALTAIRAADQADTYECDAASNNGNCDFGSIGTFTPSGGSLGGVARVITTSVAHGFEDGRPTASAGAKLSDLVTIAGATDPDCNGTWPVKRVGGTLANTEFVVTAGNVSGSTWNSCDDVTGGTVELAHTAVQCIAGDWVPGYVAVEFGGRNIGSGSARLSHFSVKGSIATSSTTPRLIGYSFNGHYGSGGAGGLNDFHFDIDQGAGNSAFVGQVIASVGSRYVQGINGNTSTANFSGRVACDYMQTGANCLRLGVAKDGLVEVDSRHGGSVRGGVPNAGTNRQPHNIVLLSPSIEGFNDGPGLYLQSGAYTILGGHLSGDVDAGNSGVDRGLLAILGDTASTVSLTISGFAWLPDLTSITNECSVYLNDVWLTQEGGRVHVVNKRSGETGDPKRATFCSGATSKIERFALYGLLPTAAAGATPATSDYYKELAAPTYTGLVCPNCESPPVLSMLGDLTGLGVRDTAAGIGTVGECLTTSARSTQLTTGYPTQACGSASANFGTTVLPLSSHRSGGRLWVNGVTCWNPDNATWADAAGSAFDAGEDFTLAAWVNDGATQENLGTVNFTDADAPIATKYLNRAAATVTDEDSGLQLELEAVDDSTGPDDNTIAVFCQPVLSRLVPF